MAKTKVQLDQLEAVGERFGEAALDPALWPQLMFAVCQASGAEGALLIRTDAATPEDIPYTESISEAAQIYFGQGWHEQDLRVARAVPLLQHGKVLVSDEDTVTPEEMRRSPFYNEFIRPSGLEWYAAVGFFGGAPGTQWALSLQRTPQQGCFEKAETRALTRLAQPLAEVATLSNAVGRATLLGVTDALAALHQPAIGIDLLGRVLESSPTMEAVLGEDIRIRNRRLVVADRQAQAHLDALVDRMRAEPSAIALGKTEPIVIRRRHGAPVIVRLLPVPPAARSPFLGARAILTFISLEPKQPPETTLLMSALDLTLAEARLAQAVARGESPSAYAAAAGVTEGTARVQLKSIFAKTNTHRQAELVALLASLAQPVGFGA